jgi:hypothetical protein
MEQSYRKSVTLQNNYFLFFTADLSRKIKKILALNTNSNKDNQFAKLLFIVITK